VVLSEILRNSAINSDTPQKYAAADFADNIAITSSLPTFPSLIQQLKDLGDDMISPNVSWLTQRMSTPRSPRVQLGPEKPTQTSMSPLDRGN